MKNQLFTAFSLFVLMSGSAFPDDISRLDVYGLDSSNSVPINVNRNIARQAGETVQRMIGQLSPGDQIKIRSFGTPGIADQQINITVTLGKKPRMRPNKIAPQIGNIIRSIPRNVANGQLTLQPQTNIVGFVERIAPTLNCERHPTRLILLTDGIEWSAQMRGDLLLSDKADLPTPSGRILKGCKVIMFGLGQQSSQLGTDDRWYLVLRKKWQAFFEAAGVADFSAFATYE